MNVNSTARQRAWWASTELREIGRRQCLKLNRERWSGPKCGAKRKRDGEPCENPALENGRCRYHGGRVPRDSGKKGEAWHMPRWPKGHGADHAKKFAAKVKDRQRAAEKRAKRVAKMSPERRAEHERWQRSHTPGDAARRAAERERRRHSQAVAQLLARPPEPATPSDELAALNRAIVALRARLEHGPQDPVHKVQLKGGVFD